MKKHAAALLFLLAPLALTACGGGTSTPAPAPAAGEVADDQDDGAQVLASRTVTLSPAQARALGISPQAYELPIGPAGTAPLSPVTVTVAVKLGKAGSKYAGQKRAFIGWKLNGKTFPDALSGTTSGTYALQLTDANGSALGRARTGSLNVTLPLASGNMNTSRSRSTSYTATTAPACAVAEFDLTLPNKTSLNNGTAPLVVCEAGVTPPPPPPAPAPSLEGTELQTWFSPAHGRMNAFAWLYGVPEGATVTTRYTFRDAEECGAGDRYGVDGSGQWSLVSGSDREQPVYRVPIDEQSMMAGQGLEYLFTVALDGKTRQFAGVLCYRSAPPQAM